MGRVVRSVEVGARGALVGVFSVVVLGGGVAVVGGVGVVAVVAVGAVGAVVAVVSVLLMVTVV